MVQLSDMQAKGVKAIGDWYKTFDMQQSKPYFELCGYAGSGKTTILPEIVNHTGIEAEDIAFCAPTGKAAKVMSTKLKGMGFGAGARTIHSTIYLPNAHRVQILEQQIKVKRLQYDEFQRTGVVPADYSHLPVDLVLDKIGKDIVYIDNELDNAYSLDTTPTFSLNLESQVRYKKLIICDEASMVGTRIAEDLMSFNIPILAIGDPGQLPPVDDDLGFLTNKPDFMLTEIHRQAKDNPIIWLATKARNGEELPLGTHGNTVKVIRRSKDDVTYDMDRELQVIVGTHRRRWNVTKKIRQAAGYDLVGPMKGEPLLVCKNSKKDETLKNGDFVICDQDVEHLPKGRTGFVLKIIDENGNEKAPYVYQGLFEQHYLKKKNGSTAEPRQAFKAQATSENIDWGHAITCHKSQGSQWDEVALHDEGAVFGEDASKWRYTGITRAAERLTVIV